MLRALRFALLVAFAHCSVASTLSAASPSPEETSAKQPNVLFIFLDDFGWRDAGFMGSDFYETPHLDALDESGQRDNTILVFTSDNGGYGPATCETPVSREPNPKYDAKAEAKAIEKSMKKRK